MVCIAFNKQFLIRFQISNFKFNLENGIKILPECFKICMSQAQNFSMHFKNFKAFEFEFDPPPKLISGTVKYYGTKIKISNTCLKFYSTN